ncbi:hypothetical protein SAY87_010268 [Trapa incisa]|uniref:Telomerase reverse transcriptase n=1 Tax=Trapa incisa TaxID=236973 RepID=A0AAN7GHH9_9MYRT|nr:hypothetical protein SAY87_010268 [Trapa incisa]
MKSKKKKKVPEILWRLFGERARPLIRIILSLLPPPSPFPALKSCEWCKGRHCLNCSSRQGEAAAAAFLCKSDDPPDYRKLLHQCFVVFDDNAPSYSGGFNVFSFRTQREIVAVVITTVQRENRSSGNVICNGYDKLDRSSATLELLSSAAWCLLLERVGCTFMFYLLSNTSIFLPTSVMKYHQVAGPPITRLSHRLYKRRPGYHFQQGAKKKRIVRSASGNSCSSSQNCMKPLEQDNKIDCDQTNATMVTIGCSFSADEEVTLKAFPGSINQTILPDRKHRITFSWQQCSKKKRLKVEEYDTPSTGEPCDDKYILRAECHCNIKSTLKKISMLCSCCLQFQAIGKFHKGCQIQRRSIFYNLESSSSGFPKRHELNRLRPDTVGAVSLLRKIFDLSDVDSHSQSKNCLHEGAFCGFHSSCLYHSIIKLLKSLIRRSRQCQYSRLLEKHCAPPSPLLDQDASTKETSRSEGNGRMKKLQETTNLENPEPYCSKSQVVSFLWAVCRSIIPPELLGTPSNWRILRRNIYKFIELRRYEKFSLKQCMYKLKASRFTFLADPSSPQFKCSMSKNEVAHSVESHKGLREILSNLRHKILERWIYWFFSCLIVPLVQANFYVTESEHGKQEVFYYRKTTWKKLTSEAMGSLTGQVFADLNDITVQNIVTKRSYGLSKVRFRPKKNGLRMLVNLRSPSFVPLQQFSIYGQSGENKKKRSLYQKIEKLQHSKSVNSFLLDTHAVLKNLKLNVPEKLGSTVSDYNDVYRKIYPFILDLKNGGSAMPEVYIVVSDVVKAFDSLDQDKLLGIMNDLITEPVYILAKSCEMNCSRKSVWVRDKFSLAGTDVEAGSIHGIIINRMAPFLLLPLST